MACFTCQLVEDVVVYAITGVIWLWPIFRYLQIGKSTLNNPCYSYGQFVWVALSNSGRVGREISPPQGSPPAVFISFKSGQRERERDYMLNFIHEHMLDELQSCR